MLTTYDLTSEYHFEIHVETENFNIGGLAKLILIIKYVCIYFIS